MAERSGKKGLVYVASLESHPGVVKVGWTAGCPYRRARTLSGNGLGKFTLEWAVRSKNATWLGDAVHIELTERLAWGCEYFRATVGEVQDAVDRVRKRKVDRTSWKKERSAAKGTQAWKIQRYRIEDFYLWLVANFESLSVRVGDGSLSVDDLFDEFSDSNPDYRSQFASPGYQRAEWSRVRMEMMSANVGR